MSCSYLQRTTLEQELGLAAYLVRAESRPPHNPGPGSDLLESDAEKLSSTDNEEEEGQENGEMRRTYAHFKMYELLSCGLMSCFFMNTSFSAFISR